MAKTILTVSEAGQRFGTELIFSGISFVVTEKERVALVGPNGSGKSSLLRILVGDHHPAEGTVSYLAGTRVAYQAQEASFSSDRTMYEEALESFQEVREIGEQMTVVEQQMSNAEGDELDNLIESYSELSTEFEARHGYEIEHRTQQVLSGLGFPESMFDEPVKQLSGGQKTRVSLAKTLLSDPDLLLLDEPTNHLDLEAIEWLESFLQSWNRAFIVVSHDRYFLDKVTTRTLEMTEHHIEDYPAGYVKYLKLREERRIRRQKEYDEQQEFIERTEEYIRKYKAGQRSREARGRETRLARLERLTPPPSEQRLNLNIRAYRRTGGIVLRTEPLTIGYATSENGSGRTVLCETDELLIERGDRVALIGPNGSGKTTALRAIVGEIPTLKGTVEYGTNVKLAYYAQGHEGLDEDRTVLNTILHDQPIGEEAARTLLGSFLFSDDDVFKSVSALSGGERSRLALARLTLANANFLILDEPTNHLDILARETLEDSLAVYGGTILFVSHDRFFINKLASKVWSIENQEIKTYIGNYDDMLRRRAGSPATEPTIAEPVAAGRSSNAVQTRNNADRRDRSLDRQIRDAQRQLHQVEQSVSKLEARLNELNDELSRASATQDIEAISMTGIAIDEAQTELEQAYDEWSAAGARLDELESQAVYSDGG